MRTGSCCHHTAMAQVCPPISFLPCHFSLSLVHLHQCCSTRGIKCMPHRQIVQDRWAPSACTLMFLDRPIVHSQVEGLVCRFCGGLQDCAAAEQRHLFHVSAPRPGPYQRQQHSRGEQFDKSVILCTLSACSGSPKRNASASSTP